MIFQRQQTSSVFVLEWVWVKPLHLRSLLKNLPKDKRICILSSRISYSDSTAGGFEEIGVKLNHYKIKDKRKLYKCKRLIIQMESLHKIGAENSASNKGEYNYLILDEFSSLCRQFFSSTMDENRLVNAIIFERLIRNTPNIIVMDAFLNKQHIELLKHFRPREELKITHYIHPSPIKCFS